MDTVPYILMQDRLSTRGSFILCDCNAQGFPIRYASAGFCDLFGYSPVECKGRRCGDLVAEPRIRAEDPGLLGLAAAAACPSPEAASAALADITAYASRECKAMMARPTTVTGFALVPNCTKSGEIKVIELAMVVCRHPTAGWLYSVGLQTDVTEDVSVQTLFESAAAGTYADLVKAQEPAMQKRLRLLDIGSSTASQYLDVKASEMWTSLMLDALEVEVKPLSAAGSELSTMSRGSSEESESVEESEVRSRRSSKAPSRGGALEQIFEIPASEWKPQTSVTSTAVPEVEFEILAFSRHGTDEGAATAIGPLMAATATADPPAAQVSLPGAVLADKGARPSLAAWQEALDFKACHLVGVAAALSALAAGVVVARHARNGAARHQ